MKHLFHSCLLVGAICAAAYSHGGHSSAHHRVYSGPPVYKPIPPSEPRKLRITVAPKYSDNALARRQEARLRAEERKQRAQEFRAARAEQAQLDYEDWHERYLADTPVREKYYQALDSAYRAQEALAYERAAYAPQVYIIEAVPAPVEPLWGHGLYGPAPYPTSYFFYGW